MTKDYAGGQAIIEGVMMQFKGKVAFAVRKTDGTISLKKEKMTLWSQKYKLLKKPFIRGIFVLFDTLVFGIKALNWSANESSDDEDEKLSKWEIVWTITISFLLAILLFVLFPLWLTNLTPTKGLLFNLIDGIIRVVVFILYVWIIGKWKDVARLFQYHGAEHKTINCYESGKSLTVKNVKKFTTLHKRCGTTFIIIVLLISIIIFSFILWNNFWIKFFGRILLMPIVAGISYELLRLGAKYDNIFLKSLTVPGFWVQKLTTKEPDNKQIEVAIKSLKAVL